MKNWSFLAAACAAWPLSALAADAPVQPPCGVPAAGAPAMGALPARPATRPEPQRGSVAPSSPVPSHVETPSMKAMRAAQSREAALAAGNSRKEGNCQAAKAEPGTEVRAGDK